MKQQIQINKIIKDSKILLSEKNTNSFKNENIYILIKIINSNYHLKCFPYKNQNWKIKIINTEQNIEKEIYKSISTQGLIKLYGKLNTSNTQLKSINEIINYTKQIKKEIQKK